MRKKNFSLGVILQFACIQRYVFIPIHNILAEKLLTKRFFFCFSLAAREFMLKLVLCLSRVYFHCFDRQRGDEKGECRVSRIAFAVVIYVTAPRLSLKLTVCIYSKTNKIFFTYSEKTQQ